MVHWKGNLSSHSNFDYTKLKLCLLKKPGENMYVWVTIWLLLQPVLVLGNMKFLLDYNPI